MNLYDSLLLHIDQTDDRHSIHFPIRHANFWSRTSRLHELEGYKHNQQDKDNIQSNVLPHGDWHLYAFESDLLLVSWHFYSWSVFDSDSWVHRKLGNIVRHLCPTRPCQIKANAIVCKCYQGSKKRRKLAKSFDHRLVLHSDYNDNMDAYSDLLLLERAPRDRQHKKFTKIT